MQTAEEVTADPTRMLGGVAGGVPLSIWVACGNPYCHAFGVQRQVWLKRIAVGVVPLPLLLCERCCHRIAIPSFPVLEEEPMPKIHVGREPTHKADIAAADEVTAVLVPEPVLELDQPDGEPEIVEESQEPEAGDETVPEADEPEPELFVTPGLEMDSAGDTTSMPAKKTASRKATGRKAGR